MVESKFQTSFIPKKPIDNRPAAKSNRRPTGLFRLIAVLILLISLAIWGSLILWKLYLNNKIESAKSSLAASEKEFELGTVSTLDRLNTKLISAQKLVSTHLAMSKLFDELSAITLKNVQFNDFKLTYSNQDNDILLTMKGRAASYAAVAKQSDAFSQDRNFHSPIFSDLDLDNTGEVVFSVSASLNPKDFLYGPEVSGPTSTTATTSPNANPIFNPNPQP